MPLNSKQKLALDYVKNGYNIFITGNGGTGKSYVVNKIIEWLKDNDKQVMITAPTGIAAINIDGVTLHRTFKIPLQPLINAPKSMPSTLKDTDTLIIDEISMVRIDVFEFVSAILVALNKFRRSIGKKDIQVIVVGDFFQLPPVMTDEHRNILEKLKYGQSLGKGYAFQSKYWNMFGFKYVELEDVVRQNDKEFIDNLDYIRHGDNRGIAYFNTKSSKSEIKHAIMICGTNRVANDKNEEELGNIHSKEFQYKATIEGEVKESDKVAPELLRLKIGCRVMTLVNGEDDKYKNGTLATVVGLAKHEVEIETDEGERVTLEKYTWNVHDYKADKSKDKIGLSMDKIGSFTQFPLKLAYAITIHKSQGQTYEAVNLDPVCWDCGQLYVALSRVKSIDNLYLHRLIQDKYLVTSNDVKNFYKYYENS